MIINNFIQRHNGPRPEEITRMLKETGVSSIEQLIDETVPAAIRLKKPLDLPEGINEYEYLNHIREVASKNKIYTSFIGMGYYNTITPSVILRNILENPGWYTSYTPYQAEISQGRLEALLNFQTMVSDLTGMPLANASLLDEGTAAAEAMLMFFNNRSRDQVKNDCNRFFVACNLFPHTVEVIKTRAIPLGIEVITGDYHDIISFEKYFGGIIQYPDKKGEIHHYRDFIQKAHAANAAVAVTADLLSLVLLSPPGEWGADAVVGSTQRFGIPMGFGGPHAAYFATIEKYKRNMPGRIIGISADAAGNKALRMALQTREQHIKRERATSNICTAQALLATMAGMYAVYHGPEGLRSIARDINLHAAALSEKIKFLGVKQINSYYFDTISFIMPDAGTFEKLRSLSLKNKMNFRFGDENKMSISVDETTGLNEVNTIVSIFAEILGKDYPGDISDLSQFKSVVTIPEDLQRTSPFLTQKIFNSYHSETEMMRYIKKLEIKDLSLNRSMIPLGSCTMKLNAATEMFALSWPEFGSVHPFVPDDQAEGYLYMIRELEKYLCEITGLAAVSFMPNSGAAGEYAGLLVIRSYHISKGDAHRNIMLIPSSAHGTNPASAAMAGMEIIVVACDARGNIDLNDLRIKAEEHKDRLAGIMVTYPSTHGVYEEGILELTDIVHQCGGLVYMDGANMNAQVGLTNPGVIGADVCHLNLHKTFAIPHGGGGPGAGPIAVARHLVPFLPGHIVRDRKKGSNAVASAPYGSALILTISYAYIKMAGGNGLLEATKYAILNANYLKSKLEKHYPVLYTGNHNRVAHEMILDCNHFHHSCDIQAIDIAKRLMDYGFHAPTVAFPVHGTLMVEPTESEPLYELDRFIDAMISIRKEIEDIENGKSDRVNNIIRNAPHTALMVTSDNWNFPYSRQKAAYPMPWSSDDKYWPSVTRIDDAFGDRNLVCSCQD